MLLRKLVSQVTFPFNWFPQRVRTPVGSDRLEAVEVTAFPFNWFPQRVRTFKNGEGYKARAKLFPFNWFPQRVRTISPFGRG